MFIDGETYSIDERVTSDEFRLIRDDDGQDEIVHIDQISDMINTAEKVAFEADMV